MLKIVLQVCIMVSLFVTVNTTASAQERKIPVAVDHQGGDTVGKNIVVALKEAVRRSMSMTITTDLRAPRIKVEMVSVDNDSKNPGLASGIAVAYLYHSVDMPRDGAYITVSVHVCGNAKIEYCAQSILANIDSAIEWLRKRSPHLWRTLQPTGTVSQ
jgi:hypothetical protein